MSRSKSLLAIVLSISAFSFSGCKKDLLQFRAIQKIDSHTSVAQLNKIMFVNDTLGYIVGGQRTTAPFLLVTKDAGYTWRICTIPATGSALYDITTSPSGNLYISGYNGAFLYSTDTGAKWAQQGEFLYKIFTGIAYVDAAHGIMVGGISFNQGWLAHLDVAGNITSWDSLSYQLNEVKMQDRHTGYITGYGIVLKTTDGGKSWTASALENDNFYGICIRNANDIWTCGYNGNIYESTNQGSSWKEIRNGNDMNLPSYHLHDIIFKDQLNGWAVGDAGVLIHTDDGGQHWMEYSHFTSNTLLSIAFCPNGDLMVVGENGDIYRFKP